MMMIRFPSAACIICYFFFVANTSTDLVDGFSTTISRATTAPATPIPVIASGSSWTKQLEVRSHYHQRRRSSSLFAEGSETASDGSSSNSTSQSDESSGGETAAVETATTVKAESDADWIAEEFEGESPSDVGEEGIATVFEDAKNDVVEQVKSLDINLIANVVGEVAQDLFSVLRFRSANLLTSTLPKDQRDELLQRMGASAIQTGAGAGAGATAETMAEEMVSQSAEEPVRGSIQEEIVVAKAEEAQKNERRWKREKETILKEMEEAADARVENELKIQKMKLDEERIMAVRETKASTEAEKKELEKAVAEVRAKAEALEAMTEAAKEAPPPSSESGAIEEIYEEIYDVEDHFEVKTDEELARNKELEAIMEERQEQQTALEEIVQELRSAVGSEEEQRDQLQGMVKKRQDQQEELNEVESNLKKQVEQVEAEKARYQELVEELEAMKGKVQELQMEVWEEDEGDIEEEESSEAEAVADTEEGEESEEELEHPVLGPVIADLGYKRIHLVSSGRLGTIPIWNRNRIYRNNRAKAMSNEKLKTMETGFPGVIGLHEASNGKLSIVDGQHRVGMMAAMRETINKKGDDIPDEWRAAEAAFERVLVEVYPEQIIDTEGDEAPKSSSDDFAEKIFIEINKAEPVKLIDMPGVASASDRKIITEACENLQDQYSDMFSTSQRCRVPNVNLDNLRSMIFGADILKKHKLTTGKKLTEWLLEQNSALAGEYENSKKKQKLFSKKQWDKASSNNFYLGLESSWLYK